ncbi:MAG: bifunctional 4-hydroxy-2-oxoglutarate aldolase/2-dehydro-3-deoxy-phosphogluconate aldolase [Acidobacteriaceae bacterium]|nr:bifunctional 4-hydroxy-2-oxoglutarate aldolase/2-dehydro-3-deoxy-phosphogluconate aldolase [Acidobacteriaceae bacterium]
MSRDGAWSRIQEIGIIPAVRTSNPAEAVHAAAAIRAGGIPIIEVSLAPAGADAVLAAVVNAHRSDMLIGAGSVTDADILESAVRAGAQFIVTPGFSEESVLKAREMGVAIFAGAITPTEVQVAAASGADAVKLFPCYSMGGPRYVRALRGQYPNIQFIASGGVSLENCSDYVRAGACAIGVGGDIADGESMAAGDHRVFTIRAKRFREALANARLVWEPDRSINVGEAR